MRSLNSYECNCTLIHLNTLRQSCYDLVSNNIIERGCSAPRVRAWCSVYFDSLIRSGDTEVMRSILIAVTFFAIGGAALEAGAEPVIEGNTIKGVRNTPYCEIIPVVRDRLHLKATVYNTLGLNDCPSAIWDT